MISDFLESHAFPFVMQFCNRSFLCPLSQYPLQIPNKAPISLPSGPSIALPGIELVPNHTASLNLEPRVGLHPCAELGSRSTRKPERARSHEFRRFRRRMIPCAEPGGRSEPAGLLGRRSRRRHLISPKACRPPTIRQLFHWISFIPTLTTIICLV